MDFDQRETSIQTLALPFLGGGGSEQKKGQTLLTKHYDTLKQLVALQEQGNRFAALMVA